MSVAPIPGKRRGSRTYSTGSTVLIITAFTEELATLTMNPLIIATPAKNLSFSSRPSRRISFYPEAPQFVKNNVQISAPLMLDGARASRARTAIRSTPTHSV
jgi:hypothetical protein